MDAPLPLLRLPILHTPLQAWASVPRNIGLLLRLYAPWLAVFATCLAAIATGVVVNSGTSVPSAALLGGASWVPGIVMIVALVLGLPAVAVGWTRGIHNGEVPAAPIRIDAAVWAYLGTSVLIALGIALAYTLSFLLVTTVGAIGLGLGDGPMSLERLLVLVPFAPLVVIPTFLLLSRFSLVLPAIAVGQPMSFARSFQLTTGNTWRLTCASGLIYVPVAITQGTLQLLSIAFPGSPAIITVGLAVSFIVLVFYLHALLSFGSLALRRLAPIAAG